MILRRALAVLLLCWPLSARAEEIWLAALEPEWRSLLHLPPNDFLDLFHPDAPWPRVAAQVTEFRLSRRFVLNAPEAELAAVVADLNRRHIAIAMQVAALRPGTGCGFGVAGYGPPDDAGRAAARLRAAGGVLEAAVLDAPVFNGHFFAGPAGHPACQQDVADLAQQAAAKIRQIRAVFPHARIGELEPLDDGVDQHDFHEAMVVWFANLALVGRPVSFVQADVQWWRPGWQERLTAFSALVAQQQMALGILYAGGFASTARAWTDAARWHYRVVETRLHLSPAIAAFEARTPMPEHLLPETQDDTLTGLVLGYLAFRQANP